MFKKGFLVRTEHKTTSLRQMMKSRDKMKAYNQPRVIANDHLCFVKMYFTKSHALDVTNVASVHWHRVYRLFWALTCEVKENFSPTHLLNMDNAREREDVL